MKKILLVVSMICVLFLVGCKTNENEINEKNNEVIIENEQQEVVDWVYDANYEKDITVDSYETEFGEVYNAKDIIVPFINIDSEDAVEANDEIKQIFDSAINNFNSGVSDKMTYVDECSYKEYINNNKLSVVVTYGVGATDVVHPEYYTYNFDLENGNEFSYEEAYAYAGLDSTNIDDNVKNAIRYKMKEKFGSALVGEDFENYTNRSIENYENSLKDNTIKYFINEKGNLNIIVTLEAPVGRETFDTIVEVHSKDFSYTSLDVLKNQKRVPMEAEIDKLYDIGNVKIGNNIFDLKYIKSERGDDEAPTGFSIEERVKFYKDDVEKLELLLNTEMGWGEYTKELSIFKDKYLVTVSETNAGDTLQFLNIYDENLNKITDYIAYESPIVNGEIEVYSCYENYYLIHEDNVTYLANGYDVNKNRATKVTYSISEDLDGNFKIDAIAETTEGVMQLAGRT